jgi:CDP-glucose 4,6-dehydratase
VAIKLLLKALTPKPIYLTEMTYYSEMAKTLVNLSGQFEAFTGKTVVVTGHTGFKGSWLAIWLKMLGANVIGVALTPTSEPSLFEACSVTNGIVDLRVDVRDSGAIANLMVKYQPDFVFHLAAQSLVHQSYANPLLTWETNLLGTLNVLEGVRKLDSACSVVIITSDKCYENVEWIWGYREIDRLGGIDPYSASKAAAEIAIKSHVKSYFPSADSKIRIASARAGNVIGGGDWAENRIVPDCVRNWSMGENAKIRNPNATRPWQHVLEPLSGYMTLALALSRNSELHGESFNFGPQSQQDFSVLDLVNEMSDHWNSASRIEILDTSNEKYEAGLLKLNCDKALSQLNWHTALNFKDTVRMTSEWYRSYYQDQLSILKFTEVQISEYLLTAKSMGLEWAL